MKVNILFPVLDEERRLEKGVLKTLVFLKKNKLFDYQLTIIDNGSTDATEEISKRLCETYKEVRYLKTPEKGVGVAVRTGVADNTCEIVGYMDIDLSTKIDHLKEVKEIFENQSEVQIIKGSRLMKDSTVLGRKASREFTSQGLNTLLHLVFKNRFTDALCGFDFYRKETIEQLIADSSQDNGWFYTVELLLRAERRGLDVHDIPVIWKDDYDTKVKVIKTVVSYLKQIHLIKSEFIREDRKTSKS